MLSYVASVIVYNMVYNGVSNFLFTVDQIWDTIWHRGPKFFEEKRGNGIIIWQ